jgi:hypothetical protein
MSANPSDFDGPIASQEALIAQLRSRGLPTYMATNILEKLITDQDAAAARTRLGEPEHRPGA